MEHDRNRKTDSDGASSPSSAIQFLSHYRQLIATAAAPALHGFPVEVALEQWGLRYAADIPRLEEQRRTLGEFVHTQQLDAVDSQETLVTRFDAITQRYDAIPDTPEGNQQLFTELVGWVHQRDTALALRGAAEEYIALGNAINSTQTGEKKPLTEVVQEYAAKEYPIIDLMALRYPQRVQLLSPDEVFYEVSHPGRRDTLPFHEVLQHVDVRDIVTMTNFEDIRSIRDAGNSPEKEGYELGIYPEGLLVDLFATRLNFLYADRIGINQASGVPVLLENYTLQTQSFPDTFEKAQKRAHPYPEALQEIESRYDAAGLRGRNWPLEFLFELTPELEIPDVFTDWIQVFTPNAEIQALYARYQNTKTPEFHTTENMNIIRSTMLRTIIEASADATEILRTGFEERIRDSIRVLLGLSGDHSTKTTEEQEAIKKYLRRLSRVSKGPLSGYANAASKIAQEMGLFPKGIA